MLKIMLTNEYFVNGFMNRFFLWVPVKSVKYLST